MPRGRVGDVTSCCLHTQTSGPQWRKKDFKEALQFLSSVWECYGQHSWPHTNSYFDTTQKPDSSPPKVYIFFQLSEFRQHFELDLDFLRHMEKSEETQSEIEELKPSVNAVEFIDSIVPRDLDQCVFADSLVTVSNSDKELGDFSVSVTEASYNEELCYLLHANSHGMIDGIPCGTTIVAYISGRLEILEENHHEYVKLDSHTLDRKLHLVRQHEQLVVNRIISEKEGVKTETLTFPLSSLKGFVSEASNFLILRILARKKIVPENMTFLSFNEDTVISKSVYRTLGWKKQMIGEELVDIFGIERAVSSSKDIPTTWHCYFLSDGHLASRVQLGSPAMMKILHLPLMLDGVEKDQHSVFEKKPLQWDEDMELYSKFLDRKEELKADYLSYVRQHPELKALMADFLQFLLLRKPQDVFSFARDFFAPFSSQSPPGNPCEDSQNIKIPEILDNKP
ncbi:ciliogenesis-associated TTC17-interacting protein isoform X2 [Myxocyprinus asiaticus]|nr:ciliogenesis-associated TTC17-interacting protein isoform X2 [Myxocyprinus asiaticus]